VKRPGLSIWATGIVRPLRCVSAFPGATSTERTSAHSSCQPECQCQWPVAVASCARTSGALTSLPTAIRADRDPGNMPPAEAPSKPGPRPLSTVASALAAAAAGTVRSACQPATGSERARTFFRGGLPPAGGWQPCSQPGRLAPRPACRRRWHRQVLASLPARSW
jgi:hypothetical protein